MLPSLPRTDAWHAGLGLGQDEPPPVRELLVALRRLCAVAGSLRPLPRARGTVDVFAIWSD